MPEYAVDYRNSRLAVSPDGSRVAVLQLNSAELEIVPLPGQDGTALPRTSLGDSDQLDSLFGRSGSMTTPSSCSSCSPAA